MIIEALQYYFNSDLIGVTEREGVITEWNVQGIEKPSSTVVQAAVDTYIKEVTIPSRIDEIAYRKIINIVPEYKQRNMTARSTELLEKQLNMEELTTEEIAERDYIRSVWKRVKSIRAHAKYLKEQSIAGNNPDINTGWSE
jgi:hypothetical protein